MNVFCFVSLRNAHDWEMMVNRMHPVVENVFIINYVALFLKSFSLPSSRSSATNEFVYLFKDLEICFPV